MFFFIDHGGIIIVI